MLTISDTDNSATFSFEETADANDFVRGIPANVVTWLDEVTVKLQLTAKIVKEVQSQIIESALLIINGEDETLGCQGDYATVIKALLGGYEHFATGRLAQSDEYPDLRDVLRLS